MMNKQMLLGAALVGTAAYLYWKSNQPKKALDNNLVRPVGRRLRMVGMSGNNLSRKRRGNNGYGTEGSSEPLNGPYGPYRRRGFAAQEIKASAWSW